MIQLQKADMADLIIIGGGLAGCEAAWQAAALGIRVTLYEMRPHTFTPAHTTEWLAEIVCSNSFGSDQRNRPAGLLKAELRKLNSFIMSCAEASALPAGGALAVDREIFGRTVTERLGNAINVEIIRREITGIPDLPCIIASGPLTSPMLADNIAAFIGNNLLYFYDAIAPIIELDSIDLSKAFWGSRYGNSQEPEGDYLNCPLNEDEYDQFIRELISAQKVELRLFEKKDNNANNTDYFEACLPVEILASRDQKALSYGPMRPVGITNPYDGSHPFAVLQLRQDNLARTLVNMVGFQTNLTFSEQERVFRMIPGLQHAVFTKHGQMHRNTYINAPLCIQNTLQSQLRTDLFFAGQITGVEGYTSNIASGLVAGINAGRLLTGKTPLTFPSDTMVGALMQYIAHTDPINFQPMKANFGLLPELDLFIRSKREKKFAHAKRALRSLANFLEEAGIQTNAKKAEITA